MEWKQILFIALGAVTGIICAGIHLAIILDEEAKDRWEFLLKFFVPFGGLIIMFRRRWRELKWHA
jgi:hypothetical protein